MYDTWGTEVAQGPLLPNQRVEFPHLDRYYEVRNERWPNKIGYDIEFGSLRYGFRGAWGRDSAREAFACLVNAMSWDAEHINK